MEREEARQSLNNEVFFKVLKNAYEKGLNEPGLTLEFLMEDLRAELKKILK